MSKKDEFIKYVEDLMKNQNNPIEMNDDAKMYWEAFVGNGGSKKLTFTDNGKLIMEYLKSLPEGTPLMKAKDIAESMGVSSRTVSGSIRKLVSDGFVEKVGQDPVMYALTEAGRNIEIDND